MEGREEVIKLIEKAAEKILPLVKSFDIDSYWETLQNDGVVIIENLYSPETVDALNQAQQAAFDHVNKLISSGIIKETSINWIAENNELQYLKKKVYYYDNIMNISLGKGRYDYQWGLTLGIFSRPEIYFPSPIKELVIKGLHKDFHQHIGTLPLLPHTEEGDWHRDTLPLFTDNKLNLSLPPWFYTLLIPLVDISQENGSTQFILGSHKCSFEEANNLPKLQVKTKKGSGILLDGRVFHRGMPNHTNEVRPMLYIVYEKNWYKSYHDGSSLV
jgi:hypothetical protein